MSKRRQTDRKRIAGFCIYCGINLGKLSKEHIIPKGLGGLQTRKGHMAVVHKASCHECATITRNFESAIINRVLEPQRTKVGVARSHGGKLPSHFRINYSDRQNQQLQAWLETDKYPVHGVMPFYQQPPIPLTQPTPSTPNNPVWQLLLNSKEEVDRLPSFKFNVPSEMLHIPRMLFKIAHAYCYWEVWPDQHFEPYLSEVIRNTKYEISNTSTCYLIGKSPVGFEALTTTPKPGDSLHQVRHVLESVDGRKLIKVRIRLFSYHTGSQTYEVIAGHILPKSA